MDHDDDVRLDHLHFYESILLNEHSLKLKLYLRLPSCLLALCMMELSLGFEDHRHQHCLMMPDVFLDLIITYQSSSQPILDLKQNQ